MKSLCSHERLHLALAGRLDAEEESLLNRHLDDCPECAAALEQLSGGVQASDEVATMLTPDGLDDVWPLRDECSTVDFVVDHLAPSDDPEVPGTLGGYDIVEVIGRGGMGVVLKGYDRELKRFVAIKALAPHLAHSALARKRFAREAQAAAAVVNLHVIAIHQVQPSGKLPFLVMPLLTGESLAQRLKAKGTLELNEVLRVGMQAADGLAAAHAQGLIHRDVKPANILLEKGVERAVLTDFGLARAADDVSMTRQGIIAGTPEYMSPEQARGEPLDGRSDLFSLGCVLYETATGVSPFRTDSTMATLRRIVDEQPASIASLVPELPPWFCHIVERLLSKDPDLRFASASEVKQVLEECLSYLQQPSSVPLPTALVTSVAVRSGLSASRIAVIAMLTISGVLFSGPLLRQLAGPLDQPAAQEAQTKPLGTVLGQPIDGSARNQNVELCEDLERLFLRPVEEHYLAAQKITQAEEFAQRIPNVEMRATALPMIRQRILHKHLYDKSGGRVLLTAFGPIAYDAYKTWLTEREQAGDFKIADPEHRKALLARWDQDTNPQLTSSKKTIQKAFDHAAIEQFVESMAQTPAGAIGNPNQRLIGEVLRKNLYIPQQLLADKPQLPGLLRDLIVPALEEHYRKQHPELEPTDAEIDVIHNRFKSGEADAQFVFQLALDDVTMRLKNTDPTSDKFNELQSQKQNLERKLAGGDSRPRATILARQRKFHRHLYNQFGGGRALETTQGVEAFDAQKKWVEEQERLGAFQISDAGLRETFYQCWSAGPRRQGETVVEDLQQSKTLLNVTAGKQAQGVTPQSPEKTPAFQQAPDEERKKLDGLWDVVEVSFMGQVWFTRGAQQVLIENGIWLGYDPHETEHETQNVRREFLVGTDNTFERVKTEGKARLHYPGRYKLDGDQLWLAVQECSLPSEGPIRAISTIVEPNVTYFQLQRRNSTVTAPDSNARNTALGSPQSIDAVTRIYNDSTARLRRDLFQPPIPDLTVDQMKAGLKLAAEAQNREGKPKTARILTDLAENEVLSNRIGQLISIGTHQVDENGATLSRLIVPTFVIAAGDKIEPQGAPGESTEEPVVLTSLSLIYDKGGYVSRKYEDPANVQNEVLREKQELQPIATRNLPCRNKPKSVRP